MGWIFLACDESQDLVFCFCSFSFFPPLQVSFSLLLRCIKNPDKLFFFFYSSFFPPRTPCTVLVTDIAEDSI